jgi:hypothetical protein
VEEVFTAETLVETLIVKMRAMLTVRVAILVGVLGFTGCQVSSTQAGDTKRKEKDVYGLDEKMLESLGQTLGFKVEARGMSVYKFSSGKHVFFVSAHNDLSETLTRADESVILSRPIKNGPDVTVKLPLREGMTLSEIEQSFRDFISLGKGARGKGSVRAYLRKRVDSRGVGR